MGDQIRELQARLQAALGQRNQALDQCVLSEGRLMMALEKNTALEAEIKALKEKPKKDPLGKPRGK